LFGNKFTLNKINWLQRHKSCQFNRYSQSDAIVYGPCFEPCYLPVLCGTPFKAANPKAGAIEAQLVAAYADGFADALPVAMSNRRAISAGAKKSLARSCRSAVPGGPAPPFLPFANSLALFSPQSAQKPARNDLRRVT
jgi:hypothetical protein